MVNHFWDGTEPATTACGDIKGGMVQHISYDTIALVSCPDCLDACCTCGHEGLEANWHLTPCPIKIEHLAEMAERRGDDFPTTINVTAEQYARLTCDDDAPTSCACTCHKPKHAARPPHENTMAGRK